jgi:hypothetical protein
MAAHWHLVDTVKLVGKKWAMFSIAALVIGIPLVLIPWLLMLCQFRGDQLGSAAMALESLFTGLALVAAISAYLHERSEATKRVAEHRQQLDQENEARRLNIVATKMTAVQHILETSTAQLEKADAAHDKVAVKTWADVRQKALDRFGRLIKSLDDPTMGTVGDL